MTVNNSANKVIAAGNGVQTVFNFGFIAVAASDLAVILTDSSGNETTLAMASYTVALNPTPPGQIWAIGGTVTYPLVGSPIPIGSTLTIVRELSLTQLVALGNQGNEFPSAVETGLDLLEMQLQQVNETFQRAIVAPVVDPTAPLPLPPVAQRANMGMAFDGNGNPIAAALPASGVISSAMQPVVDAATLALGRTALGLGTMATEGIGAGLQDDGAGNARVLFVVDEVATNQAVHAAAHTTQYMATGALTFTLDRANTLFEGFFIKVNALTAAVTFAIDANDKFVGQSSGASLIIPKGSIAILTTNALAAGTWFADVAVAPSQTTLPTISIATIGSHSGGMSANGSGTYTPPAGVRWIRIRMVGGGAGGGGGNNSTPSTAASPSTFSGGTLSAGGGGGAAVSTGGLGGSASGGNVANVVGGSGQGGQGVVNTVGGMGGSSYFGGAGGGNAAATAGVAAAANSGSGGGGGGGGATGNVAAGGAAGGYVEHVITSPASSYTYTVGAGTAGAAGTSAGNGGAGAGGQIIIEEYYGS